MSQVALKGSPVKLEGSFPSPGSKAPDFKLVQGDLSEISLSSFSGKVKVILAVPSLDTGVCAKEAKEFNRLMGDMSSVQVIVASGDLPFAMDRYCSAEGIKNLAAGSQYRDMNFSRSYGTHIADGPLQGLSARAVFVIDQNDSIAYSELVPEITEEPNYDAALESVKKLA